MNWTEELTKKDKDLLKSLLSDIQQYRPLVKGKNQATIQIWLGLLKIYNKQIELEKKINYILNINEKNQQINKSQTTQQKHNILDDLNNY